MGKYEEIRVEVLVTAYVPDVMMLREDIGWVLFDDYEIDVSLGIPAGDPILVLEGRQYRLPMVEIIRAVVQKHKELHSPCRTVQGKEKDNGNGSDS